MFTVCPSCTRQFRIYAEHIAAASGQVRCGFCHEQFNALERLYDKPLSNEKILNDIQESSEPQFDIPKQAVTEKAQSAEAVVVSGSETDVSQELKTAIDEIGIQPVEVEQKSELKEELLVNRQLEEKKEAREKPHYDFPDPEEILEQKPVKKSRLFTAFWVFASFVALLTITLQLAWFNRDLVLSKYPQLTTYVKQACQELDCRLLRQRDARAIKLLNRDVRLHPRYQDTLLVNATMENELQVRQVYPKVQLTLFDTSGALLGYRNFVPDDYLDNSIAIDEGMPVNSPVHFVLEVSGPTAGAVSFEFRFL